MPVFIAYIGVILIWSTTPLVVKLSLDSLSFPAAALGRMSLATLLCVGLALVARVRIPMHRAAMKSYAVATLGTFWGMTLTFAAVEHIPSGLISVIFGLAPVLSGVFAAPLLGERSLSTIRFAALLLAIGGLGIVFSGTLKWQPESWPGLLMALVAVAFFSLGGVLTKKYAADLNPIQHTSGSLLASLPLFALSWLVLDGAVPNSLSPMSAYSMGYLALIGSVVAFLLYFRLLTRMKATQVALIPLMTPPLAVFFGAQFAGEAVSPETLWGAALILASLTIYQFHAQIPRAYRRAWRGSRMLFSGRPA